MVVKPRQVIVGKAAVVSWQDGSGNVEVAGR